MMRFRASLTGRALLALSLVGCAGGEQVSSQRPEHPWSADSARAVSLAGDEYQRIDPGAALYVASIRTDGEDIVVEFYEGPEFVGGGARLRVEPDGRAVLEELYQ